MSALFFVIANSFFVGYFISTFVHQKKLSNLELFGLILNFAAATIQSMRLANILGV